MNHKRTAGLFLIGLWLSLLAGPSARAAEMIRVAYPSINA